VRVDEAEFHRFLGSKASGGDGSGLDVEALYLVCACARGDRAALRTLDEQYLSRIDGAVIRAGAGHQVDDVKQLLRERILVGKPPRILSYGGRGSLLRWLRAAAARIGIDLGRTIKPAPERDLADLALEAEPSPTDGPEIALLKQRYRTEFKAALSSAIATLEPEARSDLRLYYLDGVKLKDLAALRQVGITTVHRRLQAAREAIFDGARRRMRTDLELDDAALDSVIRLIGSRLEVSRAALESRR